MRRSVAIFTPITAICSTTTKNKTNIQQKTSAFNECWFSRHGKMVNWMASYTFIFISQFTLLTDYSDLCVTKSTFRWSMFLTFRARIYRLIFLMNFVCVSLKTFTHSRSLCIHHTTLFRLTLVHDARLLHTHTICPLWTSNQINTQTHTPRQWTGNWK